MAESGKIELPLRFGQIKRQEVFGQEAAAPKLAGETIRPSISEPASPERAQPKTPRSVSAASYAERAEILRRVATFKAHQVKIGKDREKYYEGVKEKIRQALADQKPKEL